MADPLLLAMCMTVLALWFPFSGWVHMLEAELERDEDRQERRRRELEHRRQMSEAAFAASVAAVERMQAAHLPAPDKTARG